MHRQLFAVGLFMAVDLSPIGAAHAVMGGPTIISRVDKDGDHKLSLSEVREAADRRYDLIKSKNGGHVTLLQLGGRLVAADLKAFNGKPSIEASVTKEEYLALVSKFFDEADARRKPGDPPGTGKLDVNELSSDAGKKLVGLLQ